MVLSGVDKLTKLIKKEKKMSDEGEFYPAATEFFK